MQTVVVKQNIRILIRNTQELYFLISKYSRKIEIIYIKLKLFSKYFQIFELLY